MNISSEEVFTEDPYHDESHFAFATTVGESAILLAGAVETTRTPFIQAYLRLRACTIRVGNRASSPDVSNLEVATFMDALQHRAAVHYPQIPLRRTSTEGTIFAAAKETLAMNGGLEWIAVADDMDQPPAMNEAIVQGLTEIGTHLREHPTQTLGSVHIKPLGGSGVRATIDLGEPVKATSLQRIAGIDIEPEEAGGYIACTRRLEHATLKFTAKEKHPHAFERDDLPI